MVRKQVSVVVKGLSGLLMNRYPLQTEADLKNMTPQQLCERALYKDPVNGKIAIPSEMLQRALVSGAAFSKGKGRASLQKQVAACVFVTPAYMELPGQTAKSKQIWRIDTRSVVIPATKGRIPRHRPCFDEWSIEFELEWDNELLSEQQVRNVLDDTGSRVGICDFRPERKGPFGRFIVTSWKVK